MQLCGNHTNRRTSVSVVHEGQQGHLVSPVTATSSCMAARSASTLWVLKPFPEKGTQKKRMLKKKARGQHAGMNPEEKETM